MRAHHARERVWVILPKYGLCGLPDLQRLSADCSLIVLALEVK